MRKQALEGKGVNKRWREDTLKVASGLTRQMTHIKCDAENIWYIYME